MIIKESTGNKAVNVRLVEPEINRTASEYIVKNFDKLTRYVAIGGIGDKASDLVTDVYIRLVELENEGNGFDIGYFDKPITVAEFVYSRINKYMKASKYRSDVTECKKFIESTKVTEKVPRIGLDGQAEIGRDGKVIYDKVNTYRQNRVQYVVYATSPICSDEEELGHGMSYMYNSAEDETCKAQIEDIDDVMSIESSIELCLDIADKYNAANGIRNMIKNLEEIGRILGRVKTKKDCAIDALHTVRLIAEQNDEFKDALEDIITYSVNHNESFKGIVANM